MQNTSLRNLVNSGVSEEEKKKVSLFLNDFETIGDLKKYINRQNNYKNRSILYLVIKMLKKIKKVVTPIFLSIICGAICGKLILSKFITNTFIKSTKFRRTKKTTPNLMWYL